MFFTILAIIGKILLTILKILLFLFLLVLLVTGLILFVPVRYGFSGSYHGNDIRAEGEVSWLIHFISLRFWYKDGKTPYILRIAGIKILPGKIKEKKERKGKQKAGSKHKNKTETEHDTKNAENKTETQHNNDVVEKKTEAKQDIKLYENKKDNEQKNKDKQKKSLWKNIVSKLKSLMQIPKKIADLFRKVSDAVKKLFAAVRSGKEKAVLVKEFVFGRECIDFVCVVRDNVLHLWKHIKPKLLRINMTIGFDDPAVMGQVLGVIAAFCGAAGIMPCVTPEFEKQIFESDIEIKGRITVFVLLKILIKVYFCEELKEFKKSYKSIREVL